MKNNKRRTPQIRKRRADHVRERRDTTLASIIEISRILSSNLDIDTIWDALHDHINLTFDTTSFFIALYEYEHDHLVFPLVSEDGLRVAHEPIPVCGLSRAVMVHGVEFYLQDTEVEAARLQTLGVEPDEREPGRWARSWIGVPLRSRQSEIAGLIALQNVMPNSFDDRDLSLLIAIAAPLSLALDTLRVAETERERRLIAGALMEIGQLAGASLDYDDVLERILDQLQRVISYDSAAILLPAADDQQRLIVSASHDPDAFAKGIELRTTAFSPLAKSLNSQQPVVVADAVDFAAWWEGLVPEAAPIRSWLILPMAVQEKIGGLIVLGKLAPLGYTQKHASSAFALGRQGAVVLETTRLEAQSRANLLVLQQRARRLASINRITGVITSSLDRDEVFYMTAQLLIELFEADHCSIAMIAEPGDQAVVTAEYPDTSSLGLTIPQLDNKTLEFLTRYGTALALGDVEDSKVDDVTRNVLRQYGVKATLIAPLIVRDRVIGTLSVDMTSGTREFTDEECETLVTIAGQVAMAVSRANLYEEALAVNRLRTAFIANVSHELRTPLNSILGYSDMLLSEFYGTLNEQQQDRVARINSSGKRLLGVLDDVLHLSKIEAGQVMLTRQPLRASEVINELVSAARPQAEAKNLSFKLIALAEEPLIYADRQYLAQIIGHLIDNAIKFTASGGIKLELLSIDSRPWPIQPPAQFDAPEGEWLAIRIIDTGIGIRASDQRMIFESFRQVDSSGTREYEGVGLGLAISQRLVELHDGYLWVESEVGAGSVFTVLLPTLDADEDALSPAERGERGQRPLVLVIDDGSTDRQLINASLGEADYQIICTDDLDEALEIARELQPDILIADRAGDGSHLLRRLEVDALTEGIPVIVIAAENGSGDVLVKPFAPEALRVEVKRALGEHGHKNTPPGEVGGV